MLGLLRQSTRAVVRGRTLCAAAEAPRSAGQQFSDLEHYTRGPRLAKKGMLQRLFYACDTPGSADSAVRGVARFLEKGIPMSHLEAQLFVRACCRGGRADDLLAALTPEDMPSAAAAAAAAPEAGEDEEALEGEEIGEEVGEDDDEEDYEVEEIEEAFAEGDDEDGDDAAGAAGEEGAAAVEMPASVSATLEAEVVPWLVGGEGGEGGAITAAGYRELLTHYARGGADLGQARAALEVMAARGMAVGPKDTRPLLLGMVQAGHADAALTTTAELVAAGHGVGRAGFHALLGGGADAEAVVQLMADAGVEQSDATRALL